MSRSMRFAPQSKPVLGGAVSLSSTLESSTNSDAEYRDAIFAEQVRLFYRLSRFAYAGTLINSLIIVFALWDVASLPLLASWFVLVLAVTASCYALYRAYSSPAEQTRPAALWAHWFVAGVAAMGALWGGRSVRCCCRRVKFCINSSSFS